MLIVLTLSAALLAEVAPKPPSAALRAAAPARPVEEKTYNPAAVGQVAQSKDDKYICRKEQLLGSRLFKTVCGLKSDMDERRGMDQQALRVIQDASKIGNPSVDAPFSASADLPRF